ncbi:MAG TPA: MFS transporter, partial [Burkholderiaceae bacterium]
MNSITAPSQGQPGQVDAVADAVYRKVAWRLIPLLFLCYIAAYLDRVNVGFAKLQMQQALQFSDSVYGFGAG